MFTRTTTAVCSRVLLSAVFLEKTMSDLYRSNLHRNPELSPTPLQLGGKISLLLFSLFPDHNTGSPHKTQGESERRQQLTPQNRPAITSNPDTTSTNSLHNTTNIAAVDPPLAGRARYKCVAGTTQMAFVYVGRNKRRSFTLSDGC